MNSDVCFVESFLKLLRQLFLFDQILKAPSDFRGLIEENNLTIPKLELSDIKPNNLEVVKLLKRELYHLG